MPDKKGKLAGKRAIITGASNGIGAAIARRFAEEGADLFLAYGKDRTAAESVLDFVRGQGSRAAILSVDLSDFRQVEELLEQAFAFLGSVHILVNNAAAITRTKFLDLTVEQYDKILDINLKAPFFLLQGVARHMIASGIGGSVINISSVSAVSPVSRMAHYQCSKAGLNALAMSAAYELGAAGIRVNTIMPGLTATKTNRNQWEGDPALWAKRSAGIPLERTGVPEDHVAAALLLASDESSWITGTEIVIDGGGNLA